MKRFPLGARIWAVQVFLEQEVPKLAEGFSEPLPSMLARTEASSLTAYPAVDKLPHPVHGNGIAYIGDAWHPMSPYAGWIPCAGPPPFLFHAPCRAVSTLHERNQEQELAPHLPTISDTQNSLRLEASNTVLCAALKRLCQGLLSARQNLFTAVAACDINLPFSFWLESNNTN
jgi:hypothetical protein